MKRILTLLLLCCSFPGLAQNELKFGLLAESSIDEVSHDTIKRTYWQVLEHASVSHHMTTFYRFTSVNGRYYLDLKVMEAGDPFVVAKNDLFKIRLERNIIITLYNEAYRKSCAGCGAKGNWGNDAEGVQLSFRLHDFDVAMLMNYFANSVRLYTADGYMEHDVNYDHSELFMDELYVIYNANSRQQKARIID